VLDALEGAEEREPGDRTMAGLKFTVGLGLPATSIEVFEDSGTSSEQLQLDRELWGDSEREEEVCVSPDFSAAYVRVVFKDCCIDNFTAGLLRLRSHHTYISRGSDCSVYCHMFVGVHMPYVMFGRINISLYWSKYLVWKHDPHFNVVCRQ